MANSSTGDSNVNRSSSVCKIRMEAALDWHLLVLQNKSQVPSSTGRTGDNNARR